MDIYKLNEFKFYYKYINNKLPQYFQQLHLIPNDINNKFAQLCTRHNIPHLTNTTNNAHPYIKSKFATHSIQGLSKYVKQVFIGNYISQGTRANCYTCSRENV